MKGTQSTPTAYRKGAAGALLILGDQLNGLALQIHALERRLLAWHGQNQESQRLATIPGVGIITSTALSASATDPRLFRSRREFAAFLGLVPRQNSSGGKDKLGRISKKGGGYLRKLLVVGATSVIRRSKTDALSAAPWGPLPARAAASAGGHRRHGQQDRPDRVGGPHPRRGLPTRRSCLIKIVALERERRSEL